jgi:hypothetical protein
MPTRPSSPDPSRPDGTSSAYSGLGAGLGAGMDFFQDWFKAASSALPHLSGQSATGTSAWTLPTLDPEELDKRIQELKTVQFWLEQNARMIGMTIQTLEVQRMTLDTLKGMKVPMDALRESLKARVQPAAPEPEPVAPAAPAAAPDERATPDAAAVNPMQWWSTLTEQFTNLAQQAVQAGQDAVASTVTPPADDKAKRKASVSKAGGAEATSSRKASARAPRAGGKTSKGAGSGD